MADKHFKIIVMKYCFMFSDGSMSLWCSKFVLHPERRFIEPWRFLTYGVAHADFWHLFQNLTGQLLLGYTLELSHNSLSVAIVYFVGIICGGIGVIHRTRSTESSTLERYSPILGASGKNRLQMF